MSQSSKYYEMQQLELLKRILGIVHIFEAMQQAIRNDTKCFIFSISYVYVSVD